MMSQTLKVIQAEALKLPEKSRAELAEVLLASLESGPDPEVEDLWLKEAERRRQELLRGQVGSIPAEDVFRRVAARLR